MPKKRTVVLSVSSEQSYKKCPWNWMLRYLIGWKPDKDKKVFRMGTAWHKCHEIIASKPKGKCWRCIDRGSIDPVCYLCSGTGQLPEELMESVVQYLDFFYADMPEGWDEEKWNTEKFMLLYAFVGHQWKYPASEFEVIATEIPFSLPVINPATGRKLPACRLDGIIDELWRHKETGLIYIGERKSTSSSVGSDGVFWERLALSKQVTTYLHAARMLQLGGALESYGIKATDPLIHGAYYDVWCKPGINPKFLTQGESKAFVTGECIDCEVDGNEDPVMSHEYMGQEFEVEKDIHGDIGSVGVNGVQIDFKVGKKEGTYQIRETPEMYGARLLRDITEDPDRHFDRREVVRSELELESFADDCVKMVDILRFSEKTKCWMRHEGNCKTPFKCDYYEACHHFRDHPLDPSCPPEGYVATHTKKEGENGSV